MSIRDFDYILMMPMGTEGGSGGGGGGTNTPRTPTQTNRDTENTVAEAENNLRLAEDIVTAKIMTNEQLLRQKQIMEEINDSMGAAFEAQKARMSQQQIFISNLSKDLQEMFSSTSGLTANMDLLEEKYKDFIGSNQQLYEEITDLATAAQETEDPISTFADGIEKLKGELDVAKAAAGEFDSGTKKMAKTLGFASSISETFTGKLTASILKFRQLESSAAKNEFLSGVSNTIEETLSIRNLFVSMFESMVKAAFEFDDASKKLNATIGDTNGLLFANSGELARMGLSASDQATIVTKLTVGFKNLSSQTEEATVKLKTNIAALQSLGVEASDTTKILTALNIGLKMPTDQVMNLTNNLAANAKVFGMTRSGIIESFASMSSSLVSYGDDIGKVFIGIAKHAKRTGIAINQLNSLVTSFDKFKEAATKVSKVNAIFGTSLSAMALNSMDADERLGYLQQQFRGLDPGNMTRYQKLAFKDAMGFQTVAEAVQFLGGELSASEKEQIDAINTQKEMSATLKDLAKSTLPLMKQLESMFAELTQNEQVMKALTKVFSFASSIIVGLSENIEITVATFGALILIGKVLPIILAGVTGGLYGMGTAMIFATGGLVLLIAGLVFLFNKFHETKSPAFYLLFGVVALGIFAIGIAAMAVQPGLLTLVAVFIGVGLSLAAIFYGMNMVVESLTGLFTVINEGGDSFPKAGEGLHKMATGMAALGASSLIATASITAALAGVGAIAKLFNFGGDSIEDLVNAGEGMDKMGGGIEKFATGLEKIKVVASELKSSLGESIIAAGMEGDKMSIMVGKEAAVATLFKNNTLNIKVDMPDINIPTPEFTIKIDGKVIEAKVEQRFNKQ